jgi:aryl-alcohol dehydrogenase-like predicted oxidoreductase
MYLSIDGRPSETDAVRTVHAALDAGITLIDTADVYCLDHQDIGHNERLIARALREKPGAKAIVATKGGLERPKGAWTRNARPAHLRAACEKSLEALGIPRIDVYQLHAPDPSVSLEDSVGELSRLKAEGKIAHVGLSNVSVEELDRARAIVPIVSVQNRWNPQHRGPEQDGVLARCTELGIAFLPYSPFGGAGGRRAWTGSEPSRRKRVRATSPPIGSSWRGCSRRARWSSPSPARGESRASSTARRRPSSSCRRTMPSRSRSPLRRQTACGRAQSEYRNALFG